MVQQWFKLICSSEQLQLLGTLNGGQSFRWKLLEDNEVKKWIGVFSEHVWILKQNNDSLSYQVYGSKKTENFYNELLSNYFQLNLDLKKSYSEWSLRDPIFKKAASQFYGIRILKQDVTENIFSFICSSNNNITRISRMVENLARLYGKKICDYQGEVYYAFPNFEALADDKVEGVLRKEGFGYRAKYINQAAKMIIELGGDAWIEKLKKVSYDEAKSELMCLAGIGPKVADCICLMSLQHFDSIPVDTHVYQIARKFYLPDLPKRKTVTANIYKKIGDYFRLLYGSHAGWAHTVLFCADLKKFQNEETTVK